VYIPYAQQPDNSFDVVLQTTTPIEQITPLLRSAIAELDRNVPAYSIAGLDRALAAATQQARFASALFTAFALLALLLATVGVYGVMAYYVSTSAREIAVRMALGAAPSMVQSYILRRGGLVIVLGTVLGGAAALGAAGLLRVLLFAVPSRDPITFLAVAVVLCVTGLLANYIPALRATRIAPYTALRSTM
jgi:ABC-type antimicrobial peptide transport system permease subunit